MRSRDRLSLLRQMSDQRAKTKAVFSTPEAAQPSPADVAALGNSKSSSSTMVPQSPKREFLQEIPGNSFVPGRSAKGGTISREKDNFTVLITYSTTKSPDTCLLAPLILSTDCNTTTDKAGRR